MSNVTRPDARTILTALVPVGLYLLALAIRLVAAERIPFPTTEPSAYYAGVAGSLVAGEGLVSHGVWSYATPPLVVPKPAFELWLPMSTFISALVMGVIGPGYWAAQVGGALMGALVAPLAWALGRESARAQSLDARRGGAVALASGLLAALLGPLVFGSVVPDSYMPFTVFVVAGAMLIPRVLGVREYDPALAPRRPSATAGLSLGVLMGLAYLSRQEVVWLGLTMLVMLGWVLRYRPAGMRVKDAAARSWPVVIGGLVIVVPWLLRNAAELGSPFPGQAIENMFLVRNEDIFAFAERPSAARYLEQGLGTVLWNPVAAAWDSFITVIALPPFPVGLAGLAALVGMRRSPALRRPTSLVALLVSGTLTFVSTMVLFPVATLWGTFMHASGPLLVGLVVLASLGGDALLARISVRRHWERPNVILAPIALISVAGILMLLQVTVLAEQSRDVEARYAGLSERLEQVAARDDTTVPERLLTDHPMWLSIALDRDAIALPDEDHASVLELARLFDAPWMVVVDERGRYPQVLLDGTATACLTGEPEALEDDTPPAWLFRFEEGCTTP